MGGKPEMIKEHHDVSHIPPIRSGGNGQSIWNLGHFRGNAPQGPQTYPIEPCFSPLLVTSMVMMPRLPRTANPASIGCAVPL